LTLKPKKIKVHGMTSAYIHTRYSTKKKIFFRNVSRSKCDLDYYLELF